MSALRTFIGLDLCNEYKTTLGRIQTDLKIINADIKWVEPKNCHITLKFLGQTNQDQIKPIINTLNELARNTKTFAIDLGQLGAFPSIEHPEIIWIGITQGHQNITTLFHGLENQLDVLGFSKEIRPFHPHITLGRKRSDRNIQNLSKALKSTTVCYSSEEIQHISLFESTLSSEGPRYSVLHQVRLKT